MRPEGSQLARQPNLGQTHMSGTRSQIKCAPFSGWVAQPMAIATVVIVGLGADALFWKGRDLSAAVSLGGLIAGWAAAWSP